jgi:hypothetical protein
MLEQALGQHQAHASNPDPSQADLAVHLAPFTPPRLLTTNLLQSFAGGYSTPGDRSSFVRVQLIVMGTGADATPSPITTSVLAPAGVPAGTLKLVDDWAPGAIDTEVKPLVRAYVTAPVAVLVIRTSG